jgi:hypothetical protein
MENKANNPIKEALLLSEEKKKALSMPTDDEIMNTFIIRKGNITKTASDLCVSTRYINSRIALNPEVDQARELGRVSTIESLYEMMLSAVQTGFTTYYNLNEKGEIVSEEKVKIEVGTRLFHMMKIIDINKSRIGIKKEQPVPTVNNFVQVNVLSSEKLQKIEDILLEESNDSNT